MFNLSKVDFFKMPEAEPQILPLLPGHDASALKFKDILNNEINNLQEVKIRNDNFRETPSISDGRPDLSADDSRAKISGNSESIDSQKPVDQKEHKSSGKDALENREAAAERENIIKNSISAKDPVKNKDDFAANDRERILSGIDIMLNILKGFNARLKGADEFRSTLLELKNFLRNGSAEKNSDILNLKQSLAKLDALFKKLNIDMQGHKNHLRTGDAAVFSELKKEAMQLLDNLKRHIDRRESGRINIVKNEAGNETSKSSMNERLVINDTSRPVIDDKLSAKNEDSNMNFNFFRKSADAQGRDAAPSGLHKNSGLGDRQFQSLLEQAKITVRDGRNGSFNVRLFPESLGRVNVSLKLEDGILAGRFLVESSDAKEALQSNMNMVRESLEQSGISVGEFQVNVRNEKEAFEREQADLPVYRLDDSAVKSDIYDMHSYYQHDGEIDVIV